MSITIEVQLPPSDYAWIIDKDHLNGPGGPFARPADDEKGVVGPSTANITNPGVDYALDKEELAEKYQHHNQFRMYDDDQELYYTGTLYWNGDKANPDEDACYGPLGDYGMPNAGCVLVAYTGHPEFDCG